MNEQLTIQGKDGIKGGRLTVLPTSVLDIAAQKKRDGEDHGSTSSRENFSPFPHEAAILCYELFLRDALDIFDPFAGWGERHFFASKYGKRYIGYDISEDAILAAETNFGVQNTLANSIVDKIPAFDGLITCPPYWNLERYAGVDNLSNSKSFFEFNSSLQYIFHRCYISARSGAIFCVVVGDWRSKGIYYDLEFRVCKMFDALSAIAVDKVVLSRKGVSKIKIMLPQCKRLGYTVKVHETLLVFKKP